MPCRTLQCTSPFAVVCPWRSGSCVFSARKIRACRAPGRLQAFIPEARQVRELLERAQEWLAKVEAARATQPPPPLKDMRLLLHSGAAGGGEGGQGRGACGRRR